jgi:hypothetical protein
MSWIEFSGPVGAGKSSLLPLVAAGLRDAGQSVAGDRVCVDRRAVLVEGTFFMLRHRALSREVVRALAALPLPLWHRRQIAARMLRLAATDAALRTVGPDIALVDEGWTHRAVNLFAWRVARLDADLERYLATIPRPDVVIVVDAPAQMTASRVQARGLPKALRGRREADSETFLERSRVITTQSAEWLDAHHIKVIYASNAGSVSATASAVIAQLLGTPTEVAA